MQIVLDGYSIFFAVLPPILTAFILYVGVDPYRFFIRGFLLPDLASDNAVKIVVILCRAVMIYLNVTIAGQVLSLTLILFPGRSINVDVAANKFISELDQKDVTLDMDGFSNALAKYKEIQLTIHILGKPERSITLILMGTGFWISVIMNFLTLR